MDYGFHIKASDKEILVGEGEKYSPEGPLMGNKSATCESESLMQRSDTAAPRERRRVSRL
jgi:hypothetical protein